MVILRYDKFDLVFLLASHAKITELKTNKSS